jgi:predicted sugar kinase
VNISSRKKLMQDAERILNIIKEETEGVDSKVEKVVNKIKDIMLEKNDKIAALIELSKLVEEKEYTDILNSLHDIQKVYDKAAKKQEPIMVDSHYLVKYAESIQAKLMVCAGNKLNNKECAVLRSALFTG